VDLDWFSAERIDDPARLARDIQASGIGMLPREISRGTLHATVSGVRVSFLEYPYPLLQPAVTWPDYQCLVASLDDLACMKLSALVQRGAKRDFIDLYALGREHKPLAELVGLYGRKYGIEDTSNVLYALAYFDDADRERLPRMRWDVDWRTVKGTIQEWVRDLAG
jgi:hypothetical protein